MPVEEANSTWHPAFMPNAAVDISSQLTKNPSSAAANIASHAQDESPPVADFSNPTLSEAQSLNGIPSQEFIQVEPNHEQTEPTQVQETTALATESHAVHEPAPATTRPKRSKHLASDSFARTVTHEANWDLDDDDVEWSLPNDDKDPFKFLGASDRTNSFPAVPPIQKSSQKDVQRLDRLLPISQAEELMAELDREASPVKYAAETSHSDFPVEDAQDEGVASDQYVGQDTAPSAHVEAPDARYEEGIPLIPRQHVEDRIEKPNGNTVDPFATESTGGDDDFFAQIGDSSQPAEDKEDDLLNGRPLERKSTMQVLGSLGDVVSPTRADTGLESMLEESPEDGDFWSQQKPADEAHEESEVNGVSDEAGAAQTETEPQESSADLAAKWAAAFGDDDDDEFILDDPSKEVDPAAFFGDDDDGFLEDVEETAQPDASTPVPAPTMPPALNGRYTPAQSTPTSSRQASASSQYFPGQTQFVAQPASQIPVASPFAPAAAAFGAPPPRPEPSKAASFSDKSKGGYTSPYDLPADIVKPRKRPAAPQKSPLGAPQPPAGPPSVRSSSTPMSPPMPGHTSQPVSPAKPPSQRTSSGGQGFFEDLPVAQRARPASRSSLQSMPSPQINPVGPPQMRSQTSQGLPHGQAQAAIVPGASQPYSQPRTMSLPPQVGYEPAAAPSSMTGGLVAPERVSPYAALQSGSGPAPLMPPPAAGNRYSPAAAPAPAASRYSPAPTGNRPPAAAYAPSHGTVTAPAMLPHQPRTSSPLAHFEISHDRSRAGGAAQADGPPAADRRVSSAMHEPRLSRMPSLPSTREVDEETSPQLGLPPTSHSRPSSQGVMAPPGPNQMSQRSRQTPPPPVTIAQQQSTLSPPKRVSSYAPQGQRQAQSSLSPHGPGFVPPPRSHTQSPGAVYGRGGVNSADPIPRPSSVHGPTSPQSTTSGTHQFMPMTPASATMPTPSRPRGASQSMNWVPPTDGREHDPLQRWKGAPIVRWGVGGAIVTSFPKDVPRYGINQALPMILRSPGEVKIKNIKELHPLEERLSKFPGPLKGKSKKKEIISWLTSGIEDLERNLPVNSLHGQITLDDKRSEERVLLWKILHLFIEHDGTLEGSPTVEKAVRDVLSPGLDASLSGPTVAYALGQDSGLQGAFSTQMKSDAMDSAVVEQIRRSLLVGDREKAVWDAADKRLWGHALLIANTVSPDLYKKVSQEFVRKEVNYPGHNNEPLAVLYEVLSGSHEECVDELVPVHARAGLQLMATNSSHGQSTDALAGLDKWRETLGLILSNRSNKDTQAINSLGNLLAGYGRAEAAHVCYLFARNATVFGGLDDPASHFVLVGADHKRQADHFAKETEALLLSEVYEYGLSLAAGGSKDVNCPHLAAYKLQHAMTLAESGFPDKALQYCETLIHAITSQTRRSPYHHAVLEAAVENLANRLRQAPKEESNSWISKPSMGKVSDSVWNRFNKFVAGDEAEGGENLTPGATGAAGPFAHVAGGTPTISRPASPPNATGMEMFGGGAPGLHSFAPPAAQGVPPPSTRAGSRYAPGASSTHPAPNPYDPQQAYSARAPSVGRSSGEYSHGSPEAPRRSSEMQRSAYSPYQPTGVPSPATSQNGFVPAQNHESPYAPRPSGDSGSSPAEQVAVPSFGYQPYTPDYSANGSTDAISQNDDASKPANVEPEMPSYGYQPPSYGYEPSPMTPDDKLSNEQSQHKEEAPASSGGYEPPSFQPYEPPSAYDPDSEPSRRDDGEDRNDYSNGDFKPMSFMDDAGSTSSMSTSNKKSKEDVDKENEEMFRKAAEEDAKRAEAEKASKGKKGWLGGWFGGGAAKKDLSAEPPKAIKAKLGEENKYKYDEELKRWVPKSGGGDAALATTSTPPPPRGPRSSSATPPPPAGRAGMMMPPPAGGRSSAPPPRGQLLSSSASNSSLAATAAANASLLGTTPPMLQRTVSNGSEAGLAPPSRPGTAMSNASSIDDLLSAAGPRKPGAKKPRKSGRYVDIMAK